MFVYSCSHSYMVEQEMLSDMFVYSCSHSYMVEQEMLSDMFVCIVAVTATW